MCTSLKSKRILFFTFFAKINQMAIFLSWPSFTKWCTFPTKLFHFLKKKLLSKLSCAACWLRHFLFLCCVGRSCCRLCADPFNSCQVFVGKISVKNEVMLCGFSSTSVCSFTLVAPDLENIVRFNKTSWNSFILKLWFQSFNGSEILSHFSLNLQG